MNQTSKLLAIPSTVSASSNLFSLIYDSYFDAAVFLAWVDLYRFYELTWEEFIEEKGAIYKHPHLAFWLTMREAVEIKLERYELEDNIPRVRIDVRFHEDDLSAGSDLYAFRKIMLKGDHDVSAEQ